MKIEIGKRARRQVERASSWWEENRPLAPFLFEDEFERALRHLLSKPHSGVLYPTEKRPSLRRILLPKSEYHLYFTLERNETVLVDVQVAVAVAGMSARRRRCVRMTCWWAIRKDGRQETRA